MKKESKYFFIFLCLPIFFPALCTDKLTHFDIANRFGTNFPGYTRIENESNPQEFAHISNKVLNSIPIHKDYLETNPNSCNFCLPNNLYKEITFIAPYITAYSRPNYVSKTEDLSIKNSLEILQLFDKYEIKNNQLIEHLGKKLYSITVEELKSFISINNSSLKDIKKIYSIVEKILDQKSDSLIPNIFSIEDTFYASPNLLTLYAKQLKSYEQRFRWSENLHLKYKNLSSKKRKKVKDDVKKALKDTQESKKKYEQLEYARKETLITLFKLKLEQTDKPLDLLKKLVLMLNLSVAKKAYPEIITSSEFLTHFNLRTEAIINYDETRNPILSLFEKNRLKLFFKENKRDFLAATIGAGVGIGIIIIFL